MAFDSFSAFIVMEGHGPYVWACYAVFMVLLAGMMVLSFKRNQSALRACQRRHEKGSDAPAKASSGTSATFTRVEISKD